MSRASAKSATKCFAIAAICRGRRRRRVVAISRHGGALVGEPELVARGFVVDEGRRTPFQDAASVIAECIELQRRRATDQG
jgi:hypothetical protein